MAEVLPCIQVIEAVTFIQRKLAKRKKILLRTMALKSESVADMPRVVH